MRLLLSEGANTLQALRYLLELKRPKDLIIFLRGYDLNGSWQEELATKRSVSHSGRAVILTVKDIPDI
jgi:hypothetical protein